MFSANGRTDNPTLSLANNRIVSLADPTGTQDAATKNYVDTHNYYTIFVQASSSDTADGEYAYFGNIPAVTISTPESRYVYVGVSGTIKVIEATSYALTAGTNEPISLYINITGTPYLVSTVSAATSIRRYTNTSMSIPVSAGDHFEMEARYPTWGARPGGMNYGGNVYIQ